MVGANIVRQFRSPTQLREKSKPWNSSERAVEDASPYNLEFVVNSEHGRTLFAPTVIWASPTSAKSLRSLRIYIALRARKAVQILYSNITFIWYLTSICFWYYNLHLVGLRRMRLCLKLRQGFAPRPHKPSSAGLERALYLSLRSVLYFYFMLAIYFGLLCPFLTPHSSLLT